LARIADSVYRHSPILLQNALVSAYGYYWKWTRLAGAYKQECQKLQRREAWTSEQWEAHSNQQLRALLRTTFQAPYYKKVWDEVGLTSQDVETITIQDIVRLPILEKSVARDTPDSLLINGRPPRGAIIIHTSGSSGTPVKTYRLPRERQLGLAFRERACRFAGITYELPRGTFGGRISVPEPASNGPFHRYNFAERQVYLSAFHLRPETAYQYVEALIRHKTQWLTGYGYSIFELAQMVLEQNLKAPQLKAVITTSEKITPYMRNAIEAAFSTKVYEEYGTVEDVFFVCECEYGRKHINTDAGILEIVDENFQPVPAGQEGEVLGTGFIRFSQPMIRYRIGDRAILSADPCPCGRQMPVLQEVVGRLEDTIYGPDGRRMVRFHGIFTDQPNIREGQIIQETLTHIRVRVVPKPNFSQSDAQDIVHRIHQRLTDKVNVTVERVPRIERTSRGKFRAVICNLSDEEIQRVKNQPN